MILLQVMCWMELLVQTLAKCAQIYKYVNFGTLDHYFTKYGKNHEVIIYFYSASKPLLY